MTFLFIRLRQIGVRIDMLAVLLDFEMQMIAAQRFAHFAGRSFADNVAGFDCLAFFDGYAVQRAVNGNQTVFVFYRYGCAV